MPSLHLIRHGQASFGHENYDQLSALGKQQAACLGEAWRQRAGSFDAIVTGSMQRHRQTAEICLGSMGQNYQLLDASVNPAWNEYDHQDILAQLRPEFATAAGTQAYIASQPNPGLAFEKAFNDAVNRWVEGQHDSEYTESWQEFRARVHAGLAEIAERHQNAGQIAVFTSGGPISLLSQHLLGVPESRIMQLNWTLVNCGVTKIVVTASRMFVASLNEHTHFEHLNKSMISYK